MSDTITDPSNLPMLKKTWTDIFAKYKEDGGSLSKSTYKKIISEFNDAVMDEIVEGRHFNLGNYLSRIAIVRIERNFDSPTVNWNATHKNKQELLDSGYTESDFYSKDNPEGIRYFVYYTDDWYCRFYWQKKHCKVKNKTAYSFRATRGKKGNKTKLKKRLMENDLAYLDYKNVTN